MRQISYSEIFGRIPEPEAGLIFQFSAKIGSIKIPGRSLGISGELRKIFPFKGVFPASYILAGFESLHTELCTGNFRIEKNEQQTAQTGDSPAFRVSFRNACTFLRGFCGQMTNADLNCIIPTYYKTEEKNGY